MSRSAASSSRLARRQHPACRLPAVAAHPLRTPTQGRARTRRSVRRRQCVAPAQRRSGTGYPVRAATLERAPCVFGDPRGTGFGCFSGREHLDDQWGGGVGPASSRARCSAGAATCPGSVSRQLCQRLLTGPPLRLRLSSSPPHLLSRFRPGQQDNCAAGVLAGQVGCWRWRFGGSHDEVVRNTLTVAFEG